MPETMKIDWEEVARIARAEADLWEGKARALEAGQKLIADSAVHAIVEESHRREDAEERLRGLERVLRMTADSLDECAAEFTRHAGVIRGVFRERG